MLFLELYNLDVGVKTLNVLKIICSVIIGQVRIEDIFQIHYLLKLIELKTEETEKLINQP